MRARGIALPPVLTLAALASVLVAGGASNKSFQPSNPVSAALSLRGGASGKSEQSRDGNDPTAATYTQTSKGPWWNQESAKGKWRQQSYQASQRGAADESSRWWPGDSKGGSASPSILEVAIAAPVLLLLGKAAAAQIGSTGQPLLKGTPKKQISTAAKQAPVKVNKDLAGKKQVAAQQAKATAPKPAAAVITAKKSSVKPQQPGPPARQQPQAKAMQQKTVANGSKPTPRAVAKASANQARRPGSTKSAQVRAAFVLAAAAGIIYGLRELKASNMLISSWSFKFADPWQVLTAVSYIINLLAVRVRGRLDGQSSAQRTTADVRFFTPAAWAFAIWAPIFLGELAFVVYQVLPIPEVRGAWWLAELSPWFCGAMLMQTLWCYAFRPWAADAQLQWLPASLLGLTAVGLGGAHGILVQAAQDKEMNYLSYAVTLLPIALHFGWITAATLVNANGYIAAAVKRPGRKGSDISSSTGVGTERSG